MHVLGKAGTSKLVLQSKIADITNIMCKPFTGLLKFLTEYKLHDDAEFFFFPPQVDVRPRLASRVVTSQCLVIQTP